MGEKRPFVVGSWDDVFLADKVRSLQRRKKTNLYLTTVGCLLFALLGAICAGGALADGSFPVPQGQRAVWIAIAGSVALLVTTLIVTFSSRRSDQVSMLESSLIRGFGTALDSSGLNPNKKESKKAEVRM